MLIIDSIIEKSSGISSKRSAKATESWHNFIHEKNALILEYSRHIDKSYLNGYQICKFNPNQIPTLDELNSLLSPINWRIIFVEGYLPQRVYALFLIKKLLPVTFHIRKTSEVDESPGPDYIHDVVGHIPLLFSKYYVRFLLDYAKNVLLTQPNNLDMQLEKFTTLSSSQNHLEVIYSTHQQLRKRPSPLYLLERFFMWTGEFGIFSNQNTRFKAYGAGIMTFNQEFKFLCEKKILLESFTKKVLSLEQSYAAIPNVMFTFKNYRDLTNFMQHQKFCADTIKMVEE